MLIILPPSEAKAPAAARDRPVDLASLSFPALTAMRTAVLDGLVATSARPDALARLTLASSAVDDVARNVHLRELPTRPALETYGGALYEGLDVASLGSEARRRAGSTLCIVSSLWGALRPEDRIPPYRLPICADLVGVGPLEAGWRPLLGPVLGEAAGPAGLVVDCRSSSYLAVGSPAGAADRTVLVRTVGDLEGSRGVGGHVGKHVRGELVRHLLESGAHPATPVELADALDDRWAVSIDPPGRAGRPWTLDVAVPPPGQARRVERAGSRRR